MDIFIQVSTAKSKYYSFKSRILPDSYSVTEDRSYNLYYFDVQTPSLPAKRIKKHQQNDT